MVSVGVAGRARGAVLAASRPRRGKRAGAGAGESRFDRATLRLFYAGVGRDAAHSRTRRRRKALAITDTELALIAALAIIGDSRRWKTG